jgi:hypothetical protein
LAKAKATFSVLVAAVLATRILVGWAKTEVSTNNETSSANTTAVRLRTGIESSLQHGLSQICQTDGQTQGGRVMMRLILVSVPWVEKIARSARNDRS